MQYIQSMPLSVQRDLFVGSVLYPSPRITEPRSKYYVSENLWPEKYYPPYVSGGGFIMSSVMAARVSWNFEGVIGVSIARVIAS